MRLYILLGILAVGLAALILNHDSGRTMGMDNNDFGRLVTREPALLPAPVIGYHQSAPIHHEPGVQNLAVNLAVAEMDALERARHVPTPELQRHRAAQRFRPQEQRIEHEELRCSHGGVAFVNPAVVLVGVP